MLRISPEELSEHLNGRHRLHEHLRRRLHGWRTHLQQGRKHTFLQTLGEPQRHGWRQTHLIYLFRSANFLWNLHEDFGNIIYILLILQEPKWRRWTVVWVKALSISRSETIFAMVVERPVGVEEGFRLTALKNFSIVFERIFMKEEKLWNQKLKTILSQLPLHCTYVILGGSTFFKVGK